MKVVILCGGQGTRLREETEYRPKPMVPIGDRPILWHIMKYYASFGHKDFVLCLGYKGEQIKDYFRNYPWNINDITISLKAKSEAIFHGQHDEEDWTITLANTGEHSMTGDRVRAVRKYVKNEEHFMLTYGDGVANIDLDALIESHRKKSVICTLTGVHPPGRFGELDIESNGYIQSFEEKPQTHTDYINGGFMVCRNDFFDYLPETNGLILEREPMEHLAREKKLAVYQHNGFWQPMDTFREFRNLNDLWDQGTAPWKRW